MQDEITKHTKKIYTTMKDARRSLKEKAKEIIIEIFIIVFAVTLSISLHSWSEHKNQQKEVKDFLVDLKDDLRKDIKAIEDANKSGTQSIQDFTIINELTPKKLDSLNKINKLIGFETNFTTIKINNGNYEGFKSSGKIGYIEQKKIKKLILEYYQGVIPDILEADKISNTQMFKILEFFESHSDNGAKTYIDPQFKILLSTYIMYYRINIAQTNNGIKQAKAIIAEIDQEVKE